MKKVFIAMAVENSRIAQLQNNTEYGYIWT